MIYRVVCRMYQSYASRRVFDIIWDIARKAVYDLASKCSPNPFKTIRDGSALLHRPCRCGHFEALRLRPCARAKIRLRACRQSKRATADASCASASDRRIIQSSLVGHIARRGSVASKRKEALCARGRCDASKSSLDCTSAIDWRFADADAFEHVHHHQLRLMPSSIPERRRSSLIGHARMNGGESKSLAAGRRLGSLHRHTCRNSA